ncbi:MAG: hypothetical protein HY275_05250 [Gemmatimonadetes bacterium]|nr:hypothetical protein [Gemmatimonadota bacterium]
MLTCALPALRGLDDAARGPHRSSLGWAGHLGPAGDIMLLHVRHRYAVYRGENHNSVRLASFPSGLFWGYRAAGGP